MLSQCIAIMFIVLTEKQINLDMKLPKLHLISFVISRDILLAQFYEAESQVHKS